jgi:S1-C subfamily serine protease
MNRRTVKFTAISLLLTLSLLLGAGCALPSVEISPAPPTTTAPPPAPAPPPEPIDPTWTPPSTGTHGPELPSIADVVTQVKPSVVAINTEAVSFDFFNRPFTQQGAGSGWILDENGIIVTNNHVVEGADTITVTMDDGSTFTVDANSVFTDRFNDLAVLKIDARTLPALKLGYSTELRVGDWVVAIGNALAGW